MRPDESSILSVGAILGDSGPENMAWKDAINTITQSVQASRVGVVSPLRLDVVYHVDGELLPNEFEGVRTGRFYKKDARLVVQAAVSLKPVQDRNEVLLDLLRRAVDEAEQFAAAKAISRQGLPEIRELVTQLS